MNTQFVQRRALLAIAGSAPLLSGCFYDRFFELEWDEEVQLHDGRVIVVHVKRNYERQQQSVLPYDADSIQFRGIELTFNATSSQRVAVKTRQPIGCLDQFDGVWFLVISGQGPFGDPNESPTRWGRDFTTNEQRLAKLIDGEFRPIEWQQAPSALRNLNLTSNLFYSDFSSWNGKLLTLEMKKGLRVKHGFPSTAQITRPLRMTITSGGKK